MISPAAALGSGGQRGMNGEGVRVIITCTVHTPSTHCSEVPTHELIESQTHYRFTLLHTLGLAMPRTGNEW